MLELGMTGAALRSRQVAAALGSEPFSQVAPLDWRRPIQCLWTLELHIEKGATLPP
jgi:hypothetical protein